MADQRLLLSGMTEFGEPIPADGAVRPLSFNSAGRLRVASKQAEFLSQSAGLAAVNDTLNVFVSDASNLIIHVKNTSATAMAAGSFVFEGSIDSTNGTDGTWFALQAVRSNANTIENGITALALAAGAGAGHAWELSVNAIRYFRVRCTTAVTAGTVATFTALRGSYASEPIPAIQPSTMAITGTVATTPPAGIAFQHTTTASTNALLLKSSAGNLYELTITNSTASAMTVKFYNKAPAPVPGTDVPMFNISCPANDWRAINLGVLGKRFPAGIGLAITAGFAGADTVAAAAGCVVSGTYI